MGRGDARAALIEEFSEGSAVVDAPPQQKARMDPTTWPRCKELCWNAFRGVIGFGVSGGSALQLRPIDMRLCALCCHVLNWWICVWGGGLQTDSVWLFVVFGKQIGFFDIATDCLFLASIWNNEDVSGGVKAGLLLFVVVSPFIYFAIGAYHYIKCNYDPKEFRRRLPIYFCTYYMNSRWDAWLLFHIFALLVDTVFITVRIPFFVSCAMPGYKFALLRRAVLKCLTYWLLLFMCI